MKEPESNKIPMGSEKESKRSLAKAATISSTELLGKQTELLIEHGDSLYRLRVTSQGKLILTK